MTIFLRANKIYSVLFIAVLVIAFSGCRETCDPGTSVPDVAMAFNIIKNGKSLTKTTGGANTSIIPDSVKLYALNSTTALPMLLIADSLLFFSDYVRLPSIATNNLSYRLVIGNLKPDTINVNINALKQADNCGREYVSYNFSGLKVNNVANNGAPTLIVK
jgi:hypothetical protein